MFEISPKHNHLNHTCYFVCSFFHSSIPSEPLDLRYISEAKPPSTSSSASLSRNPHRVACGFPRLAWFTDSVLVASRMSHGCLPWLTSSKQPRPGPVKKVPVSPVVFANAVCSQLPKKGQGAGVRSRGRQRCHAGFFRPRVVFSKTSSSKSFRPRAAIPPNCLEQLKICHWVSVSGYWESLARNKCGRNYHQLGWGNMYPPWN